MKTSEKVVVGVIGAGSVAAIVYGIYRILSRAKPPPAGKAKVSGVVTDAITGSPLSSVLVTADGLETTTDASGKYSLTDIDPGTYAFMFSKANYQNFSVSVTLIADQVRELNAQMQPTAPPVTGSIYGKVSDLRTGSAVEGVWVGLSNIGASWTTYTNYLGYYTFGILPPSSEFGQPYQLTFIKTGYKSQDIYDIELLEGEQKEINVQLTPVPAPGVGSVHGRVVDWLGNPVADAEPWFMTLDEAYDYWTITDANGYYKITGMAAPLTYRCGCLAPGTGAGHAYPVPNFTLQISEDKLVNFTIMPA